MEAIEAVEASPSGPRIRLLAGTSMGMSRRNAHDRLHLAIRLTAAAVRAPIRCEYVARPFVGGPLFEERTRRCLPLSLP
jgi:hypothetical protein